MEAKTTRHFVRSYLPWLAAAGMLVLYLVMLNTHASVSSVPNVVHWGGYDWRPTYLSPFTWLVTLPVRWLPMSAQIIGLNVIGAVCAALTAALLARSVALLPHDRTHDQRVREKNERGLFSGSTAWIPPLFAVLVFGLERTFWENSVVFTGETVDALLIAYVVRCLLEFRASQRDSWLYKLALVYGIGITNDLVFIPYAPVMLVAVIWVKGLRFFQFSFLTRLAAFGIAGLLLYLLLPLVQSFNDVVSVSFLTALRVNLGYQKQFIFGFHRGLALWLGGFPIVLLLVASIRWSSDFGDTSHIGSIVGKAIAHIAHVALLGFAVWILFDLATSPRQLGRGLPFIATYYLTALAAGYFIGYLLVVFSDFSPRSRRPGAAVMVPLSYVVTALVCTAALVVPAKLAFDNWRHVYVLNAPDFEDYARKQLASLPKQATAVMADDTTRLYAIALIGGAQAGHVFVEGPSLTEPAYVKFLHKKYSAAVSPLPAEVKEPSLGAATIMNVLRELKQKRDLYYLQPSVGMFFETYYLEPQQLVYRMETYSTNAVEAPVPAAGTIARQAEFWNRLESSTLRPLAAQRASLLAKKVASYDIDMTARYYSQALDFWGVELQRALKFDEAAKFFEEALVVNPDNPAAFINREANTQWRKQHKRLDQISEEGMAKLKLERGGFEGLLTHHGPVDEPSFRFETAQFFAQSGLWRQAAQNALRAIFYSPDDANLQNALASIYLQSGQPDRALAVVKTIRSGRSANIPAPVAVDVIRTEAAAHFAKGDFTTAEKILNNAVDRYPDQEGSFDGLTSLYITRAEVARRAGKSAESGAALTNALRVAERQIQQQPNTPSGYFTIGNISLQFTNYDRAIQSFTKVLELDSKNLAALLNRAIANLRAGKLDDAQRDYEKLLEFTRTSFRVYYGLAEIAYRKKDWRAAKDYYQRYLQYAPADSAETKFVRERLAEVKKKA
jgi:tetratricopeptide (TPR) repeat protein